MGYSCTVKADLTYEVIQSLSEFDINSSEYKYFCEIGRENRDGSITGIVYEVRKEDSYTDSQGFKRTPCKKKGSFKIGPQGNVIRFPGLSKRLFGVVEIASIEKYDRIYPPFLRKCI